MTKTKKKTRRISQTRVAAKRQTTATTSSFGSVSEPMTETHMTFSQLLAAFILFTVAHAVVFLVANILFPAQVVLGNHVVSMMSALIMSSGILALISVGATPLIEIGSESMKTKLSNGQWMGLYLIINVVAIWVIARLAEEVGFGISSWLVAVILGAVINVVQGMIIMSVVSRLANRSV